MTLIPRTPWPDVAELALDLAGDLLDRARAAPPSGVTRLGPRPRVAFDRLLDAANRLPRPVMVLGSLGLLASALVAPDWFAARMDALADMPEALWWLIGAVVSLHFGARYQDRAQEFRREVRAPGDPAGLPVADPAPASPGTDADLALGTLASGPNPALADWAASRP